MKHLIYMVFAMLMLASCSSDEPKNEPNTPPQAEPIELGRSEQEIVDAQKKFAVNFFKTVCNSEDPRKNIIVSPLSMSMAFSMVANGAEGQTFSEIAETLGFKPGEIDALNSLNNTLVSKLPTVDPQVNVSIANSMWVNNGVKANADFGKKLNENYKAEMYSTDLYSMQGTDAINNWANSKTNGMIPKILSSPVNSLFTLCNALYFEGKWAEKFDETNTRREIFHNGDGSDAAVDMMSQKCDAKVYIDAGTDASDGKTMTVSKTYGNGAYMMTFVLPPEDMSLNDFISAMDATSLYKWISEAETCEIYLKVPRFEVEYGKDDFRGVLGAMGIVRAFQRTGELRGIIDEDVFINKVIQKAKIKVDESGTKASVVTAIGGDTASGPALVAAFDRPFMYYISEQSTGAILFMGCVNAF